MVRVIFEFGDVPKNLSPEEHPTAIASLSGPSKSEMMNLKSLAGISVVPLDCKNVICICDLLLGIPDADAKTEDVNLKLSPFHVNFPDPEITCARIFANNGIVLDVAENRILLVPLPLSTAVIATPLKY